MPEIQNPFTVSELNAQIRHLLEGSLSDIWVTGEISNFHHHPSSGHMYFTLKDGRSEMRCALFRGNNQYLKFKPSDGMEVRVFGTVTVYEQRGQIQLKVSRMEPAGMGDLFKAFEALKKSLAEEGLFHQDRKKPIPKFPKRVGVVTSGSGAVLRDILNILKRRAPQVEVIVRSTKVQGEGAAEDITQAIRELNAIAVDVMIAGRGGGSLEDLWAFNEEIVARAIFDSNSPIILAVGHETDFTIADFVADLRAPTPSAAAELASIAKNDILGLLMEKERDLTKIVKGTVEQFFLRMDHLEDRIILQQPQKRIEQQIEKLNQFSTRLIHGQNIYFTQNKDNVQSLARQLIGLGPNQVLDRGYSIAFDSTGDIIRTAADVKIDESFTLKTGQGSFGAKKTSDHPKAENT